MPCLSVVESTWFLQTVVACVLLNTLVLAVEFDGMP